MFVCTFIHLINYKNEAIVNKIKGTCIYLLIFLSSGIML